MGHYPRVFGITLIDRWNFTHGLLPPLRQVRQIAACLTLPDSVVLTLPDVLTWPESLLSEGFIIRLFGDSQGQFLLGSARHDQVAVDHDLPLIASLQPSS